MAKSKQVLALASLNLGQRRPVGPVQSRINQNFAAVGHAWTGLSLPDRAGWQRLANQMFHDTGLRTTEGLKQSRPMTAYQCFSHVNLTLLACGLSLSTVAPDAPETPAALPPVLLRAVLNPGSDADATATGFTLTLTAPAYNNIVQVYAAAPLLAGQYPAAQNAVIIATLSHLVSGPTDLSDAYQAKFGPLGLGQQVVLSLVPVSANGFKGNPLALAADVSVSTVSAIRHGDSTRALKAA